MAGGGKQGQIGRPASVNLSQGKKVNVKRMYTGKYLITDITHGKSFKITKETCSE